MDTFYEAQTGTVVIFITACFIQLVQARIKGNRVIEVNQHTAGNITIIIYIVFHVFCICSILLVEITVTRCFQIIFAIETVCNSIVCYP